MVAITKTPTSVRSLGQGSSQTPRATRSDRFLGVAILLFVVAIVALLVWLASQGTIEPGPAEYWPMMP